MNGTDPVHQQIHVQAFSNGLTLLVEPMSWLESAAFTLLLPAGCCRDPIDLLGLSGLTCEMAERGSGSRDSRQFIEELELLGVDSSSSVSVSHTIFSGAVPAQHLKRALAIYADLVQKPHFPEGELEDSRLGCLQEIHAIEDDLAQKVMIDLRQQRYADPFGRSSYGTLPTVERISLADIKHFFSTFYRPTQAILGIAGNVSWEQVRDDVAELFGAWPAADLPAIVERHEASRYHHIEHDSSQTHIGLAYSSVPYSHPDYFQARGAVGVLSDGMSSRLFTEVREKRGLCYTVYAACDSLRDRGSVVCYAGTTTERAQETLEVMHAELERLTQGIAEDELARLKARIKSSLIMQQESSTSRSHSLAADWYHLNRVRPLEELRTIIDGLTCQSINQYLSAHPPRDFYAVTLGAKSLEMPRGISAA